MVTQVTATYPDLWQWAHLYAAYRKAAKGKRGRIAAASFEYRLEDNLVRLQLDLANQIYQPGPYASFTIHEPKRRLISAAPFVDRVVHHALCQLIEPAFERSFIEHAYANRVGKGTHRALDTCQRWAQRCRYVLSCDVVQFFPSIDHSVLRRALHRRIRDPDLRRLIDLILQSGVGVLDEHYDMVYFPGDDLFAVYRPRGLPIGNLTSQFWANCYMNSFDHFVTRELRCGTYLRYVDDALLFADDKAQLWAWRDAIIDRLGKLRLTIHENRAQVRPVTHGIPFLGFVVYPTHRLLKRRKGIAYRRRLRAMLRNYHAASPVVRSSRMRETPSQVARRLEARSKIGRSVRGWINHVRYGDTWGLRNAILKDVSL